MLLIVVGHLVLIIAVIVMANVLERPHTHADKEISVMAQTLNPNPDPSPAGTRAHPEHEAQLEGEAWP